LIASPTDEPLRDLAFRHGLAQLRHLASIYAVPLARDLLARSPRHRNVLASRTPSALHAPLRGRCPVLQHRQRARKAEPDRD
jgi:hypothetical protein